VLLLVGGMLQAADIILNEYNAVDSTSFLGGGDSSADDEGTRASDSYFGRVPGNGGDWFEMVVIKDHLDMRGWQLDTYVSAKLDKTLTLTADPLWSDLRAGTIITVAQDVPNRVSYNPAAGDWWINVQAKDGADGKYISAKSFSVTNKNFQLRIRNVSGAVVFGPAGEGVAPNAKVNGTEIFLLKDDPSAAITANSPDYDSNHHFSTFGAPNRWGTQDFNDLRPVITPAAATIKVLSPNGLESLPAGKVTTIQWQSTGVTETVLVEFSIDGGYSWTSVYPPNVGNTGQYKWLVPLVDSNQALVRVVSSNRVAVYDTSDKFFTILASTSVADLTTAGQVDFSALAHFAASWLN
jgi:hypothetical protein